MAYQEDPKWQRNVISSETFETLCTLRDVGVLENFYLAGGTGLALQFGHRLSNDLDFFAADHFNEDALVQRMQAISGFALIAKAPYTLHASLETIKVSFLGYKYPMLFPTRPFLDVAVADPREIAAMKLSALASRGAKRDFIDLYFCAKRYGLDEILMIFEKKFAQARFSRIHIFKSLTYFADAEKDPMPHMLSPLDWKNVKQFFDREVPRLIS